MKFFGLGAVLLAGMTGANCLVTKSSDGNLQHEQSLYPNTPDWELKCGQKGGYVCGLNQKECCISVGACEYGFFRYDCRTKYSEEYLNSPYM